MAALDSFNWFISTNFHHPSDELKQIILRQRDYLLTLRNEDEKERFVRECMKELNALSNKHL